MHLGQFLAQFGNRASDPLPTARLTKQVLAHAGNGNTELLGDFVLGHFLEKVKVHNLPLRGRENLIYQMEHQRH